MKRPAPELASGLFAFVAVFAQAPPAVEVASIKVHSSNSPDQGSPRISGSRLTLTGNLNQLVMYAYGLKSYQIRGGPDWVTHPSVNSDYYEIVAKADRAEPLTQSRARLLLQTLLTQRFLLSLHRETKEMPVYALVSGRSGPKFKENVSDTPCRSPASVTLTTVTSTFTKCSMDALILVLSGAADRPVLDQTGLAGAYDFKLEFARNPSAAAADSDAPSLFTAVQEQLGLKIEPRTAPVAVSVIDRVERPSQN
jgi:uncharacterized protein (TIGR03435 family)